MIVHVLVENTPAKGEFLSEHGLSLHIQTQRGRSLLFDAGQSDAFAKNAAHMGVNLAHVDTAILSHGHYDHGGGLPYFLTLNRHAPVYLSRHAFEPHFAGRHRDIGIPPSLQSSHQLISVKEDPLDLGDQMELRSCLSYSCIEPVRSFGLNTIRNGVLIPDDFYHEQYLVIEEDHRRIVFSGCSHRGVLNIVSWLRPDVLVGGFHFMDLDPQGVDQAFLDRAADLLLQSPTVYYTGHCTGEGPYQYLKERMGDQLHAIHAGSVINL